MHQCYLPRVTGLVVIGGIVAAFLSFLLWDTRAVTVPLPDDAALARAVKRLLERGTVRGKLELFGRQAPKRRLTFEKYIRGPSTPGGLGVAYYDTSAEVGLRALLPAADRHDVDAQAFRSGLAAAGIAHLTRRQPSHERAPMGFRPREAVLVDCGRDLPLAARVATIFFAAVAKDTRPADRRGRLSYITKRDAPVLTGISAPDAPEHGLDPDSAVSGGLIGSGEGSAVEPHVAADAPGRSSS